MLPPQPSHTILLRANRTALSRSLWWRLAPVMLLAVSAQVVGRVIWGDSGSMLVPIALAGIVVFGIIRLTVNQSDLKFELSATGLVLQDSILLELPDQGRIVGLQKSASGKCWEFTRCGAVVHTIQILAFPDLPEQLTQWLAQAPTEPQPPTTLAPLPQSLNQMTFEALRTLASSDCVLLANSTRHPSPKACGLARLAALWNAFWLLTLPLALGITAGVLLDSWLNLQGLARLLPWLGSLGLFPILRLIAIGLSTPLLPFYLRKCQRD